MIPPHTCGGSVIKDSLPPHTRTLPKLVMAHQSLVPKQRFLTEEESQISFEAWREGLVFHVSLDNKSSRFLSDLKTWTSADDRGFTDDVDDADGATHTAETKMNKTAKAALLNIILGSVATYAPVISARFIKQQSTSFVSIWDRLRSHYGLRKTGGRILELMELKPGATESRETYWERLYSFLEDTLLTDTNGVKHEGVVQVKAEEFTPTLLNVLVTTWLHGIHLSLPALVRQRFSTQLRDNTVFSLREEISDAIPSLLSEVEEREGIINRTGFYRKGGTGQNRSSNSQGRSYSSFKRKCCLCDAAGRPAEGHFLSMCPYLPSDDKKYISKTRCIEGGDQLSDEEYVDSDGFSKLRLDKTGVSSHKRVYANPACGKQREASIRRVDIVKSLVLAVTVGDETSDLTLDSGAEANLMRKDECHRIGVKIHPSNQKATQADGKTPMKVVGEVHFKANIGHHILKFGGLVVEDMDSAVLPGMPFLQQNDIAINYSSNTVYLGSCCEIKCTPPKSRTKVPGILRVSHQMCVLPEEKVTFQLPDEFKKIGPVAIEPRSTVPPDMPSWIECQIVQPDPEGFISIQSKANEPILVSKHTQVCQVRPTMEVNLDKKAIVTSQIRSTLEVNPDTETKFYKTDNDTNKIQSDINVTMKKASAKTKSSMQTCSTLGTITVDPSNVLSKAECSAFHKIHAKYQSVFAPGIGCYNQNSGKFYHTINMSSNLPPQRRGRIPLYNHGDKEKLQEKLDELLAEGVLARAEDVDVPVEYVHPVFLVKKAVGYRVVSSFGEMAEYARPQPTVTSNPEQVIHTVGQWKVLIHADMRSAYFHIPLDKNSTRYVGVMSPFQGTLVYLRSVMGLPGSEAALEELLSRIFGDIIQRGDMVKLADDLYMGAENINRLMLIWEEVLERLQYNGLRLSPEKTVCCPTSTTILGWQWDRGTIYPTSHRLNSLAVCETPTTVKGLRSWIGCYKFSSRVLPIYADVLHPLEEMCGGKQSADKLVWSEDLKAAFELAKDHLKKAKPVVLPRVNDQMYIVTDAAINCAGLAATLLIERDGKVRLAGYYSAALKKNQAKLLPCEMEALAIGCSIKHFSFYISQSQKRTIVLTDSKPCVLGYRKMLRGEFSSSPKVTTYLSIANRFGVELKHIAGAMNKFSDFASRNVQQCNTPECEICLFVQETSVSSVGEIRVSDILSGASRVPFATKDSWLAPQKSCPNLTIVHKYLTSGATLPKKKKNLTDVRRYLNVGVTKASGQQSELLVLRQSTPFRPIMDRVVIPRQISDGLLTALHLQLGHSSVNQLKQVFSRAFFCLDMDSKAKKVVDNCYECAALKKVPSMYNKQSTSVPANVIGVKYSIDVMKRYTQNILLIREDISSYSDATIVQDEKAQTLREGILLLISRLRSPLGPKVTIRTDPASSLRSLVNDKYLSQQNLSIELGEPKNVNKNPVAERAVEELHAEIVRLNPQGGRITATVLAQAISKLNDIIRQSKLTAREVWTQRDMATGTQLTIKDEDLINLKYSQRCSQHEASAKYKARGKIEVELPKVEVGQLIYLYSDRSKLRSRDKYLVTKSAQESLSVQKFTGNQFRKREYKVKWSDVIAVPKEELVTDSLDLKVSKQEQSLPEMKQKVGEYQLPSYSPSGCLHRDTVKVVYNDSEDDSIDEFRVSSLLPVDHHDQEDCIQPVINDARPVRITRPPASLDDYEQDLSSLFDEDSVLSGGEDESSSGEEYQPPAEDEDQSSSEEEAEQATRRRSSRQKRNK